MGAVDRIKAIKFIELVKQAYVNHRPHGSGLCKHAYDVYWDNKYSTMIDYLEEYDYFKAMLRIDSAFCGVMYQYSHNLGFGTGVRSVDVKSMHPMYRNYYHWHPEDIQSRLTFLDDIVNHLSDTDKS
tara:strand:+ start:2330 stop:2710 length:381 start_codon:yes stop_codon:yes gene_type:complete